MIALISQELIVDTRFRERKMETLFLLLFLVLHGRPVIASSDPQRAMVTEGVPVNFTCRHYEDDRPNFVWYLNGRLIEPNGTSFMLYPWVTTGGEGARIVSSSMGITPHVDQNGSLLQCLVVGNIKREEEWILDVFATTGSSSKLPVAVSVSLVGIVLVICLCCCGRRIWGKQRGSHLQPRRNQEGNVTLPMVAVKRQVQKERDMETPAPREMSDPATEPTCQTTVPDFEFPREKVNLRRVIGHGFYGQVYEAVAEGILHDGEKTTVAVKIMKDVAECRNEVDIFKSLQKHPFVVSFLGSCTEKEPFYLIMEYIPNGTLESYVRKKRIAWDEARLANRPMKEALNPPRILMFAYQIACGMEYLSSMHLVHRDLATRNVLLGEGFTCKLCDFGLARDVTGTEQYRQLSRDAVPFRWLALECLLQSTYTTKSDVWSFGVLMWELVTLGAQPYRNMSCKAIIAHLMRGFRLQMPAPCGQELYDMMSWCWKENPESRPSFSELREGLDFLMKRNSEMLDMSRFATGVHIYQNPTS